MSQTTSKRSLRTIATVAALLLLTVACGDDSAASDASIEGTTITLITHDSFALSPDTLLAFTRETGVTVDHLAVGDTGVLVAQSILNKDNPLGDVLYGIDNTFLSRALNEDIFVPYRPAALGDIDPELALEIDDQNRVTPIDYGDVCVNYWRNSFSDSAPPPTTLEDLIQPEYANQLVVQHPETSSPGLAFLLATIARFGDGWENFWADLRTNGVSVTSDWNSAYNGEFIAGGGNRPLVVSYASSPPAEVMFADGPVGAAPTGVITDTCFRQVEYAGILNGTEHQAASQALIDFMLSQRFQEDVPANMFVFPVLGGAQLPQVFFDHTAIPENPLSLPASQIEENRDAWTQRWVEITLR